MALQLVGRIFRLDGTAACKRVVSLRVARRAAWVALFLVVLGLNGWGQQSKSEVVAANDAAADDVAVEIPAVKLRPIVYLEPTDAEGSDWGPVGILQRELFRQALLVAARESLGLTTRDGSLRELLPEGISREHALRLGASPGKGQAIRLAVERGQGDRRKVLWTKEAVAMVGDPVDLIQVAAQAEEFSRTGFDTALQRAGFDGKAVTARPDVAVPPATEKLLEEMTFPAQFRAVRALHGTLRGQGESRWLLGALVRAYAHLGILTECHWGPSHKVYKARALLYAQRLIHADPQSPWGLWHRAYAGALAGLHQAALNDLRQAARLRDGRTQKAEPPKPTDRPPEWLGLVNAVCRFDAAGLASAKPSQYGRLAQLLRFRALESKAAVHLTLQAGQQALRDNPECFRIYDALANTGGVNTLHTTTLAGMEAFARTLPQQLKALPGLPAPVTKALDQQLPEQQLLETLVAAGRSGQDRDEPSWTVLGRWGQDTQFLQVCLRLWFMRYQWAVPVDDVLPAAKAVVAGHPYAKFVDSFGLDRRRQKTETARLLADIPLTDLDYQADGLFQTLYHVVDPERWRQISGRSVGNLDYCHDDYALLLRWSNAASKRTRARTLLHISPYAPAARAMLIEEDWEFAREQAEQWEKESQRPEVLLALGRRYGQLKKLDDAERCLQRGVALSPDLRAYRLLAEVYKERGQAEQWLGTLEQALKEEDTGLNHAQVQVQIARHFMAKKDFRRAQPYADRAAESWAEWAMRCASECHEGLEDWEQAELWARRVSERYAPNAAQLWFFWCKRTGKGNLPAAQQLLAEQLERLRARRSTNDHLVQATLWALTGEPRKAADAMQPVVASGEIALSRVLMALFLDEAGEAGQRDQVLAGIDPKNPYKPLADFFVACLAKGKAAAVDLTAAENVLKALPPKERLNSYYCLGRFLELRGQQKAARDFLQRRLAEEPLGNSLTAVLAGSRLHTESK